MIKVDFSIRVCKTKKVVSSAKTKVQKTRFAIPRRRANGNNRGKSLRTMSNVICKSKNNTLFNVDFLC